MFDTFLGLPMHAFVIHATLALLPLGAGIALAYAALRSWRWLLRWPLVLVAVAAPVVTFVTVQAGVALKEQLQLPDEVIGTHQSRGQLLLLFTLIFAVIALLAAFGMGGPSLLVSRAGSREGFTQPVQLGIGVLLAIAAVLVLVQVVLTGDAGSRAVWSDVFP